MAFIIPKAVQGIATGIGLGRESYKARQAKKQQDPNKSPSPSSEQAPPQYELLEHEETDTDNKESQEETTDQQAWELDEAQDALVGASGPDSEQTTQDSGSLADAFITAHPANDFEANGDILPYPILIPQRRPKDRTRGFVRAYAPCLQDRGIDETTFIEFLETFNKASLASPWLQAINLASIGAVFVPGAISILVSIAIRQVTDAAIEVQGRSRTNSFLDKVNEEFFQPRGLYALVLTFKPEDPALSTDINLSATIDQQTGVDAGAGQKLKQNLKSSSGVTHGDMFAEVAPLVYPGLDALAVQQNQDAATTKAKLKQGKEFVADYMDRRAQATFAGQNPDSALAQGPKPSFNSRYADPNHPASNGSLISLISGGKFDAPIPIIGNMDRSAASNGMPEGRSRAGLGGRREGGLRRERGLGGLLEGRLATRRDMVGRRGLGGRISQGRQSNSQVASDGEVVSEDISQEPQRDTGSRISNRGIGGRRQGGLALGGVKKYLSSDVKYLMIVDMPTEEEMAEGRRLMAEAKQKHGQDWMRAFS